jgi:hypothetical protein
MERMPRNSGRSHAAYIRFRVPGNMFQGRSATGFLHLQVCQKSRDAACSAKACAGGMLVRPGGGLCFMEGMRMWLAAGGMPFPLPPDQFLPALLAFAQVPAIGAIFPDQIGAHVLVLRLCSDFARHHSHRRFIHGRRSILASGLNARFIHSLAVSSPVSQAYWLNSGCRVMCRDLRRGK